MLTTRRNYRKTPINTKLTRYTVRRGVRRQGRGNTNADILCPQHFGFPATVMTPYDSMGAYRLTLGRVHTVLLQISRRIPVMIYDKTKTLLRTTEQELNYFVQTRFDRSVSIDPGHRPKANVCNQPLMRLRITIQIHAHP